MRDIAIFMIVFAALAVSSVVVGQSDAIGSELPRAQVAMAIGGAATGWLSTAMNWLVGLVIGGICTGVGVAAFGEISKAYKLWKRQAQAGRWQSGPNAGWQKQPAAPKLNRQDLLLLALSGRLPQGSSRVVSNSASDYTQSNDDDLGIEM